MEDVTLLFTLGAIPLNKYPYLTISGLLAGGKPTNIGGIGNSVLGEPQELLTLAPFPQINPPFLIIWGLLTVGRPHLELLAFVISYAGAQLEHLTPFYLLSTIPSNKRHSIK